MYLVLIYMLYQLVKCCVQEVSTDFDKFLKNFPANDIASVDILNTFLFATFCSYPTAQKKILNKPI